MPQSVTCSDKTRINLAAGFIFLLVGYLFLAVQTFGTFGSTLMVALMDVIGVVALGFGVYYIGCFMNRRVTASENGVTLVNWRGKKSKLNWDEVSVSRTSGRAMSIVFAHDGKEAKFYGYSAGAAAMDAYLERTDRYQR